MKAAPELSEPALRHHRPTDPHSHGQCQAGEILFSNWFPQLILASHWSTDPADGQGQFKTLFSCFLAVE